MVGAEYIELFEKAPCLFVIAGLLFIIKILWKENKGKENNIHDLARNIIKVTSVYEERIKDVKDLNNVNSEQHNIMINLLKDLKRVIFKGND